MPGSNSKNPRIPVPANKSYPGLSAYDIPSKPLLFCEVVPEGIVLEVIYDNNITHRIEVFHIEQKDATVNVSQWERMTEINVLNMNPARIPIERPNPRFKHHFTVRCVTEHDIYGGFSDPVSYICQTNV